MCLANEKNNIKQIFLTGSVYTSVIYFHNFFSASEVLRVSSTCSKVTDTHQRKSTTQAVLILSKICMIMKWCKQDPQSVYSFITVDQSTGLKYSFGCCSARKLLVNWSEFSHQDDYEGGAYHVVRHAERSG